MISSNNNAIEKERLLFVEGNDDKFFMISLLKKLGLNDTIQILPYGGKDNLANNVKTIKNLPNFHIVRSVGFTMDADDREIMDILKSIQNSLKLNGFNSPSAIATFSPRQNNTVTAGIYIFPDCVTTGELEDLCLQAIYDEAQSLCIEKFITCVSSQKKLKKPAKTKVYAWLATQDQPGIRIGEAAQKNLINFDHPAFDKLKKFVTDLGHN